MMISAFVNVFLAPDEIKYTVRAGDYWRGYFDARHDMKEDDDAEKDALDPKDGIWVDYHPSIVAIGEPPLKWFDIWKGER